MNTYYKFCPNVFLAKCDEKHEKGEVIEVTTKYGKENESIVFNLISRKMVSIITLSFGLTDLMYRNGRSKERNAGMIGHHWLHKRVMSISIARTKIEISFP